MKDIEVVGLFFEYWKVQDVELALSLASEDVVYNLYLSDAAVPHGGATRGREKCRDVLYMVLADFDYLEYQPTVVGQEAEAVRAHVRFRYHHRRTGGELSGTKRMVFTVRDGVIMQVDEYHDAGMVEAFMRLTQQREASNDVREPPALPNSRAPACCAQSESEKGD